MIKQNTNANLHMSNSVSSRPLDIYILQYIKTMGSIGQVTRKMKIWRPARKGRKHINGYPKYKHTWTECEPQNLFNESFQTSFTLVHACDSTCSINQIQMNDEKAIDL